jgi:TPR repeat protein
LSSASRQLRSQSVEQIAPAAATSAIPATIPDLSATDIDALLRLGDLYSDGKVVSVDLPKAIGYYQQAADAGNRFAKLRLGEMLARGQGVAQNVDRGRALVREVADSGDVHALVTLGELYSSGDAGPIDGAAAVRAYERAATLGSPEAPARLGDLYFAGKVVAPDMAGAVGYYRQAADAGSRTGKIRFGELLARGLGIAQDVDRGRALVREVADSGDVYALVTLGDLYSSGTAGPIDGGMASQAYEKAASLGSTDALIQLGDLYYEGRAVASNPTTAMDFYRRAADAESQVGKARLGELLVRGGLGVSQDIPGGLAMVREVAQAGNAVALVSLGDIYARGYAGRIDPVAAIRAYEVAARLGDTRALMRLGDLYSYGIVMPTNPKKAIDYYDRAARAGNAYGRFAIGTGYVESRLGGRRSPAAGITILRQAQKLGVADAAVALGDAYLYGQGVKRNVKRALSMLEQEMRDGNLTAARQLVDIYRSGRIDGRIELIAANLPVARSYFQGIGGQLDLADSAVERFLFKAEVAKRRDLPALYGSLGTLSPADRPLMVKRLRTINPRAYVFFLQTMLRQRGLSRGASTGSLTPANIRAVQDYCNLKRVRRSCRYGAMSGQTAEILSLAF